MKPKAEYTPDLTIYTDGGSRGNPGEAAYGFVVYDKDLKLIFEEGKRLGIQTNNFAEYSAVIAALRWVEENSNSQNQKQGIQFFMDSQLVVMQLNEVWKIKNENIRSLFHTVKNLEDQINAVISYTHVFREKNKEADRMVNIALDAK